jgi:leader peptidase (prepilin peptidase)/N-methyltransferase
MVWPHTAIWLALALAGSAIGSFFGAATERLQRSESFVLARSRCASCGVILPIRHLLPVVSYILLHGRCGFCGDFIPKKLVVIEVLAFTITAASLVLTPPEHRILAMVFAWALLALSWFDYEQGRLPDALTVPLGALGLFNTVIAGSDWTDHLLGGALGLAVPAVIARFYRCIRGHEGLGGGDVKMLGAIGIWTGWQALPLVFLFASVGALSFCLLDSQLSGRHVVRFGPFIAAAAWVVFLWRRGT